MDNTGYFSQLFGLTVDTTVPLTQWRKNYLD